jgi:hypothetical protein
MQKCVSGCGCVMCNLQYIVFSQPRGAKVLWNVPI